MPSLLCSDTLKVMRQWTILLLVGLVISIGVSGYYGFRYLQLKKAPQKFVIPEASSLPTPTGKPIEQGISAPEKLSSGSMQVTIWGTLSSFTPKGPSGVYTLELTVPYNGKQYIFVVDLGPQEFTIGEETDTVSGKTINVQSENKTVGEIYKDYKDRIGEVIGVVVVTNMLQAIPKNCDTACTQRLNFFRRYTENNKLLESPDKINPALPINIGIVSQLVRKVGY